VRNWNGYGTHMLGWMSVEVTAVNNTASEYGTMWAEPVRADGVEYVKKHSGVLLMGYPITGGTFTKRILEVY